MVHTPDANTRAVVEFVLALIADATRPRLFLGQAIDHGFALWKIYMNVDDCAAVHQRAVDAGFESTMEPARLDRWPVIVAFILDPDGYSIELVQRVDED